MIEVETELTNEEVEEALKGDIVSLWNVFSSLEGNADFVRQLEKVKFGIRTIFDIRSIVDGFIEYHVSKGFVRIEKKKDINITEFRDEKEERMKIMKDIIRELYDDTVDRQKEGDIDDEE